MILIEQTATYQIYISDFQGHSVRFIKDLKTGEINVNSEDMAKVFGFKSFHELIQSDENLTNMFLDGLNSGAIKKFED